MTKFPRSRKDDQVDAFAYLGRMLDTLTEAPTDKELDDDEYYDQLAEFQQSGGVGRSAITGY